MKVRCYGEDMVFSSRKKAKEFFRQGYMCSDGSERERYASILTQLEDGVVYPSDENPDYCC